MRLMWSGGTCRGFPWSGCDRPSRFFPCVFIKKLLYWGLRSRAEPYGPDCGMNMEVRIIQMKMIFLVDGDNNIGTGLTGVDMLSEQDSVLIFYQKEKGLALAKLQKLCAGTAADVQYIESVRGGKNSIDFQIITELGVLVGKREADYAYVISQDKGYAASIDALQARYANAFQEVALRPSIESCLHLPFILRAADRQDLANALVKEYGSAQGCALYNHLKRIFQTPEPEGEKPAKAVRPRRSGGRRKKAAPQSTEE